MIQNNNTRNVEITIAKLYAQVGGDMESNTNVTFDITYNAFKRIVTRKRCMLTNRPLPDGVDGVGVFIPNKTVAITKDNLFVTTKEIANSLDNMMSSCNMTNIEMKTIFKVLSKQ